MEEKEKRDSLLLIFSLFCLVMILNEIQNIIPYKPNQNFFNDLNKVFSEYDQVAYEDSSVNYLCLT